MLYLLGHEFDTLVVETIPNHSKLLHFEGHTGKVIIHAFGGSHFMPFVLKGKGYRFVALGKNVSRCSVTKGNFNSNSWVL